MLMPRARDVEEMSYSHDSTNFIKQHIHGRLIESQSKRAFCRSNIRCVTGNSKNWPLRIMGGSDWAMSVKIANFPEIVGWKDSLVRPLLGAVGGRVWVAVAAGYDAWTLRANKLEISETEIEAKHPGARGQGTRHWLDR